jgi:hypothetical protein
VSRLDQRMIKHPVVFASGHEREPGETQRGRPRSRIAHRVAGACGLVEADRQRDTEQWPPGPCAAPRGARPLPRLPKLPSRLPTVGLADHGARPHDLPSLTPGVAGGTDSRPAGERAGEGLHSRVMREGSRLHASHQGQRPPRCDLFDSPGLRFASRWRQGRVGD